MATLWQARYGGTLVFDACVHEVRYAVPRWLSVHLYGRVFEDCKSFNLFLRTNFSTLDKSISLLLPYHLTHCFSCTVEPLRSQYTSTRSTRMLSAWHPLMLRETFAHSQLVQRATRKILACGRNHEKPVSQTPLSIPAVRRLEDARLSRLV